MGSVNDSSRLFGDFVLCLIMDMFMIVIFYIYGMRVVSFEVCL